MQQVNRLKQTTSGAVLSCLALLAIACSKKKSAPSFETPPEPISEIPNTPVPEPSFASSQTNNPSDAGNSTLLPVNIGGIINHLGNQSVTLSVNGGNSITVTGTGSATPFSFVGKVNVGKNYSVSIVSQPKFPTITCSIANSNGTAQENVTNVVINCPELSNLEVTSSKSSLNIGNSLSYKATAIYKNGSTRDVSSWANWSTSDTSLATISTSGYLYGIAVGAISVQANFGSKLGVKSLQLKNVTLSSISLSPQPFSLCGTCVRQMRATGNYSDGTTEDVTSIAAWTVANSSVANVSDTVNTKGLVSGVSTGSTNVTAQIGSVSRTLAATVSGKTLTRVEIGPASSSGPIGSQQNLQAIAVYSDSTFQDVTNEAQWSSSNEDLIFLENAVAPKGRVTREAEGTATIQATYSGFTGTASTVISGLTLTSLQFASASLQLPLGWEYPLNVEGVYSDGSTRDLTGDVVWSSTSTAQVTVSNAASNKGELSGISNGNSNIIATLGAMSASISVNVDTTSLSSISVSPNTTLLSAGVHQQFKALGTFSNGSVLDISKLAFWSMSNSAVGEMSNDEESKGMFFNSYPTNSANSLSVNVNALLNSVTGTASIVVTPNTLQSVVINPTALTLPTLSSQVYKAYGLFSDGASLDVSSYVLWESSDTGVFQISNGTISKGNGTAIAEGTSSITAVLNGIASSSSIVTVNNSLPPEIQKEGVGLKAEYFADKYLTPAQLKGHRIDRNVNFNWATGVAPLGVGDNFSVRWTGKIIAPNTENITFSTNSDDGVRLYVNNVLIINNWTEHAATVDTASSIAVTAGQELDVKLEFFESGGFATIQLFWQSPLLPRQIIPTLKMFPK
jgi:trimeric autotransporter adhesin